MTALLPKLQYHATYHFLWKPDQIDWHTAGHSSFASALICICTRPNANPRLTIHMPDALTRPSRFRLSPRSSPLAAIAGVYANVAGFLCEKEGAASQKSWSMTPLVTGFFRTIVTVSIVWDGKTCSNTELAKCKWRPCHEQTTPAAIACARFLRCARAWPPCWSDNTQIFLFGLVPVFHGSIPSGIRLNLGYPQTGIHCRVVYPASATHHRMCQSIRLNRLRVCIIH